ncbi:MAG TPA: putative Ig domain-containing protein, partial [Gemmatimonadales bacterium]
RDLLDDGSAHPVNFANGQVATDGRTRWRFMSWSDGGAQSHSYSGSLAGGSLIATVARDFKLIAAAAGAGSVTADTTINLTAGDFVPEGWVVHLTPNDAGANFCGWTGDSTTTDSVLTLGMQRPYSLVANFGTSPTITAANARPSGIMGAAYVDSLTISGGSSAMTWTLIAGALPQGVTLAANGKVSGFPQQTGDFNYTAQVVSCDTQSKAFALSVTAPTLLTSDVVAQLLGPTAPLTADQVRYLDFLGNNNGGYDVGDFLAWVKATGAPLSPGVLQAAQRKGGRP